MSSMACKLASIAVNCIDVRKLWASISTNWAIVRSPLFLVLANATSNLRSFLAFILRQVANPIVIVDFRLTNKQMVNYYFFNIKNSYSYFDYVREWTIYSKR